MTSEIMLFLSATHSPSVQRGLLHLPARKNKEGVGLQSHPLFLVTLEEGSTITEPCLSSCSHDESESILPIRPPLPR